MDALRRSFSRRRFCSSGTTRTRHLLQYESNYFNRKQLEHGIYFSTKATVSTENKTNMESANETNEINPENLHLVRKLGEGDQGSVHLATDSAGNEYAVKVERPGGTSLQTERHIYDVLRMHDVTGGVPHMYGFSDGEGTKPNKLVLELLGDSLDTCVERDGFFEPPRALALTRAAMRVLKNLHSAGIVHMDLALRNILLLRAPGHMDTSEHSQSSETSDQTGSNSARSVSSSNSRSASQESNMEDSGGSMEEIRDDIEVSDGGTSEVSSSEDGDEKVVIIDFGFSEVYATPKNRRGKPRNTRGVLPFLLLTQADVRRLLASAEGLVGNPNHPEFPEMPQIESAKEYLASVPPNRRVDYDEIISLLE